MTERERSTERIFQDRALRLHDRLDDPIDAIQALADELRGLAEQDERQQRRAERVAAAADYLRKAKVELFCAGKE